MQFNSLAFLFFFIIFFAIYYALPKNRLKAQNILLLVASCVFYGWWSWRFLSLIAVSILSTYATALLAENSHRRFWTLLNVIINLAILCFFKYFNFFSENLIALMSAFGIALDYPTVSVLLPVGISFYTFQAISYSIDVYRNDFTPERNFISFALYICYFPQLVAGPIERASVLLPQINRPRHPSYPQMVEGMRQVLWGLVKKIVVADGCVHYVDKLFVADFSTSGALTATLAAILFSVQIYCDFSGYCDIARGVSQLLGIKIMQNFSYPYFSKSIQEFWRRWNISLMNWFRDYVYIPLGGSRNGVWRTYRNLFVVFLLSGLWHGASWNFVIWGFYWGVLMVIFRLLLKSGFNVGGPCTTLALAVIGWVIFRSDGFGQTIDMVSLTALPIVALATALAVGLYIWRRFGRRCRKMLLIVASMAAAVMAVTHIGLVVHHILFVYIAALMAVEWYGRHCVFALQRMPKSRCVRYGIYYLLIFLLLVNVHGSAQFIYFKF